MIDGRALPSAAALEDVLRQGREALAAGEVEGALRTFDAALRIKPTYAPAWRAKGRALRVAGNAKGALDCYAEALRHEPGDESSWLGLALALHALGRRTDEMLAYEEMLRRNPRNVAAWTNRGVTLHEEGRYEEALACYDRILANRPEIAAAWNNRGAALLRLGRPEEALAAFDEALALDPGFSDAAANRRTAFTQLGREAAEPARLSIPPPAALPLAKQPRVLANLGLPAMDAWRRNRPSTADEFAGLAITLLDDGAPEAALAAYRRAEGLGGGALAAIGGVVALDVLHDPKATAEAIRLVAFADVPRAAVLAARAKESQGDLAGARTVLATALEHRPDLGWLWRWKAILELRLDLVGDARVSMERAAKEDPGDPEAWADVAATLHRAGLSDEALGACDRALALDASCALALNNKGVILAAKGRAEEAAAVFRDAAKRSDDATISFNQAQLAESREQLRAAMEFYDDALAAAPKDAEFLAGRRRVIGRVGARDRKSRDRFVDRLCEVPGLGPATARRIVDTGFDSPARIRNAGEADLRDVAKLTEAQARAVKRAFRV
ncbi:MAG: tetratricopeptide repeat protein [Methanobacteriota archaeon]|nr:MAG: tetratricopeptide repeat protein [Euryarchaeota archaeon]